MRFAKLEHNFLNPLILFFLQFPKHALIESTTYRNVWLFFSFPPVFYASIKWNNSQNSHNLLLNKHILFVQVVLICGINLKDWTWPNDRENLYNFSSSTSIQCHLLSIFIKHSPVISMYANEAGTPIFHLGRVINSRFWYTSSPTGITFSGMNVLFSIASFRSFVFGNSKSILFHW